MYRIVKKLSAVVLLQNFCMYLSHSIALMLACAFKHDDRAVIVKMLLSSGARVNEQASADAKTALHVAAHNGALGMK